MNANESRSITAIIFILVAAIVILVSLSLTACSSAPEASDNAKAPAASTSKVVPTPNGTYTSGDPFIAHILGDDIEVFLIGDDKSKSLFWKGSFPGSDGKVVSTADRDALDASLFGSSEVQKAFILDGDKLSFEFSMMGTTKTVHVERN